MKVIKLEEAESTNGYAKVYINTIPDKTVVHALRQTAGRGRLNRAWVDLGDGNLFVSVVLKPSNTFSDIYSNLTQYLSVVLCKVLETYSIKPEIKWPNDVLVNGKKIAGILSETVMHSQILDGIVLGVGVNLNAEIKNLSLVQDKQITSLNLETGKDVDVEVFLEELLCEFFKNYDEFLLSGFNMIKDDYLKRNCFLDKEVNIQVFNSVKTGVAKSVTDRGELVLNTKDNNETLLTIGDII